jgi:AraC-like DNA-binding protein
MFDAIRLTPGANPGGEFTFTPAGVYLSLHMADFLSIEMRGADGTWRGASLRGDVKVVMPGEARTFMHRSPAKFAGIEIPPSAMSSLDIDVRQMRPHLLLRDPRLRLLLEALLAEELEGTSGPLFVSGAVQAIGARLLALNGRGVPPVRGVLSARRLASVLELIHDRLDENLSISELAVSCGMSASHFSALFKAATGMAPHRYQNKCRVERAQLLIHQGMNAADAATAVGFCDQSHLARHARRLRHR